MESFESLFSKIPRDTILGHVKTRVLYNTLCPIVQLEGNSAEIGVFKGYTSKFIHMMMPSKTHYCYDTFCGILGSDSTIDYHKNGEFACSLEDVKRNINMPNVIYKSGYFPDTFDEYNEKFCFVHSDTDTYVGTQNTIKYFCDRMVTGGKILFDDYEWQNCPGVKKAIEEFVLHDTQFEHIPLRNTTQYVLVKK
jgi:hypothetical protein